jgi:hypothetical protein
MALLAAPAVAQEQVQLLRITLARSVLELAGKVITAAWALPVQQVAVAAVVRERSAVTLLLLRAVAVVSEPHLQSLVRRCIMLAVAAAVDLALLVRAALVAVGQDRRAVLLVRQGLRTQVAAVAAVTQAPVWRAALA